MSLLEIFRTTLLDALFPLSGAEKALFSYSPEMASRELPRAPAYAGLTVPLPDAQSLFAYKDQRVSKLVWNIKYKKSKRAIEIAGYSLFQALNETSDGPASAEIGIQGHGYLPSDDGAPSLARKFLVLAPSRLARPLHPISASAGPIQPTLIIPMPITSRRRRERGFNQCELLVNEVKCLDTDARFTYENEFLQRIHHDSRHTLKDRKGRLESAKGIFAVNEEAAAKFKDSTIIVIDDVITTGSTMREALDTIRNAGFERVFGVSVAH